MSDFPLFIHGHGAVSAAGSDSASLYRACRAGAPLPTALLEWCLGGEKIPYASRRVDSKALGGVMPKHPRLRRSSSVTKFAVTAAHQAIGAERLEEIRCGERSIGIILTFLNGCVNYSSRFFGEALDDPSLASPILFPETVFNAPASHIAAYLACDGPAYTLLGDSATWFSAFEVAEGWIAGGLVEGCLIICGEEIDWLTVEGLKMYSRNLIATEGAAAIYVEAEPSEIAIEKISGPFPYYSAADRKIALAQAWANVRGSRGVLLVDGLTGITRLDRDELDVTAAWDGRRISPARVLGEGMGARCGFQTIAAIEAILDGEDSATVLAAGSNEHAFCVKFVRQRS